MKLRVGLVGLGPNWDARHRSALRALNDRFEVRAICEQVAKRAETAAKEFDAETVDGYRALAMRSDLDAILMLSPQWFGALPIHAACEAGKAVYCAAAMELSSHEAAEVRQRVVESGIAFMVEFPRRLAPATVRLKELIATQLGKPRFLFCHQRRAYNSGDSVSGNQILLRELVEMVDWCSYIIGQSPESVMGNGRRSSELGGYRMMSIDFHSPDEASIPPPLTQHQLWRLHAAGLAGSTFLSFAGRTPSLLRARCRVYRFYLRRSSGLTKPAATSNRSNTNRRWASNFFVNFIVPSPASCVPPTTWTTRSLALQTVMAAEQSYATGRRIDLRPMDGK